jgi:HPt (histidine-containing phosphotransfer) domain-containing protein
MTHVHPDNPTVLDLEAALIRVGGDIDLLREIAVLFADEGPRVVQELREALAQDNAAAIGRAAHGLKGSAANFGAAPAVEAASQIEQLARAGRTSEIAPLIQVLEHALRALLAELEQI